MFLCPLLAEPGSKMVKFVSKFCAGVDKTTLLQQKYTPKGVMVIRNWRPNVFMTSECSGCIVGRNALWVEVRMNSGTFS